MATTATFTDSPNGALPCTPVGEGYNHFCGLQCVDTQEVCGQSSGFIYVT